MSSTRLNRSSLPCAVTKQLTTVWRRWASVARRPIAWRLVLVILLNILILRGSPPSWGQTPILTAPPRPASPDRPATVDDHDLAEFTPEERTYIRVYELANRGVAHITTRAVKADSFFAVETPLEGSGSGSVIDRAGHILTNHHVIEGAQEIRVTLANGKAYDAVRVGRDTLTDIAVLRIQAPPEELHPLPIADSSRLRVGQRVIAIGNPFGFERTMTLGIISSLNRSLPSRGGRTMKSMIQVDAALNRGNSGGPLLDSHGRLIGMNTAIASSTGENTGVGFAIPSNTVARIVPQLIQQGKVVRADLGITRVLEVDQGLVIVTMAADGPAERAGLQGFRIVRTQRRRGPLVFEEERIDRSKADLVVAVDGRPVRKADDLLAGVEAKRPGESIELTVVREGREGLVKVVLGTAE